MELFFDSREQWRQWLEEHHGDGGIVWLVFFKKHTGRRSLSYDAAVEEALCFGWIDSLIKRLDDDRYARKFTPRTDPKTWSAANLERVARLIDSGRMMPAGQAVIPDGVEALPAQAERSIEVPAALAEALAAKPAAERFFTGLAPSYRRNTIHWITSAKREATRTRRVAEAVALFAEGKKLGMK